MWFKANDITKYNYSAIYLQNLHGCVLPHAGTKYTGHIIAHTLRFRPVKKFSNIIIFYLPSNQEPNINGYYHEFYVPYEALKLYYPSSTYNYIGYNVNNNIGNSIGNSINTKKYTKENTLYIVSADFSHFLEFQNAIKLENCAAHSLMHSSYNSECINVIDNIKSFTTMYSIFAKQLASTQLQWIGRTRSPGNKGVGYLSFLLRDKPQYNNINNTIPDTSDAPDGLFITAYDRDMRQRECLGNIHQWTYDIEKALIKDVLYKARTSSRLTNGLFLDSPITHYSITYLYKDNSKVFIRGYHAILKGALYLPDVFLENTYDNGEWIQHNDTTWLSGYNFKLQPTFNMLTQKSGNNSITEYNLFSTQVLHMKVHTNKKTKKKTLKKPLTDTRN